MSDEQKKSRTENVAIDDLKSESGVQELLDSPAMEPYIRFAMAVMHDTDPTAELEAIRQLPNTAHSSSACLSALFGQREMETLMVSAIKQAREAVKLSQSDIDG